MIEIKNKVDCCGCNACGDACAHGAITFKTDIEGFWYPEVDKAKCVDCGLCEMVCPQIHAEELKKNDYVEPKCYDAIHKNYEIRFDSTSGGLFSALAEKMYKDNGYVGGAVYDDDFRVYHYISNEKSDLKRLRSSKYEQSNCEGFFKQVRDILKDGKNVLVCGCPCQMAALRSFLRFKDYPNLIIADFVCRGINTPKVDAKFEEYLERIHGSKIIYQKSKNKELGWKNLTQKYRLANGTNIYFTKDSNPLTRGYLGTGVYCRPSCYDCKFKGFPRIADITLADYWGIEKIDKSMDDNVGTSLVLINSEKGLKYFNAISSRIKAIELPYESAIPGNQALVKSLPLPTIDRDAFFCDLDRMNFEDVAERYFPDKSKSKSFKASLKNIYKLLCFAKGHCGMKIGALLHTFYINVSNKAIHHDFWGMGYLFLAPYVITNISKKANIILKAPLHIGHKRVNGSHLESRLLVEDGATLQVDSQFGAMYGCDIEVFKGAKLHIKGAEFPSSGGPNINATIICGNHIEIGWECRMGRNVTIRDNNGGHYISLPGYKTSKPVIIGNHVWICEGATIMQGVKIGDGAIIGAHAVVYNNVPAYSMVSGNPARVVEENIFWKY